MTAFGLRSRVNTGIGTWVNPAFGGLGTTTFGSFESISTTTVGVGGQSTVTFSSIPTNYKHLQLRIMLGSNNSSADSTDMRFNGDTGSNYTYHQLYGTGAAAGSEASTPRTAAIAGISIRPNTETNMFSVGIIDILDYANTNKYKTQRTFGGWETNGNGQILLTSTSWMSTSAISQIEIYSRAGGGFRQYSSFALYGLRG